MNQEKSRAHLRLTVFHFVQLCFAAEARVTGFVWAVDGNNKGPFVKDFVFCFRTLFFSIVCLILCLSQDMLHELVSLVLCRLLVVAISPPNHPTPPQPPGQYVSATVTYFAKNLKNPSYKWRRQ